MKHHLRIIGLYAILTLFAGACAEPTGTAPSDDGEGSGGAAAASAADLAPSAAPHGGLRGLTTVSQVAAARGREVLLRDDPAALAHASLSELFERGEHRDLELGVYRLQSASVSRDVALRRAAELSLTGTLEEGPACVSLRDGDFELRLDRASGSELFVDRSRFHRVRGGPLQDDAFYVRTAKAHIASTLGEATGAGLFPYKLRKYINATAAEEDTEPTKEVYQIGVTYSGTIDDLPIIGPGSKVSVHMTTDGDVISHETSVRAIESVHRRVRGDSLLSPDAARAQVESRLRGLGIRIDDFELTRAELGYLRLGRFSVQNLVAPHYAFVYEPRAGTIGKRIVETIPAVTDPDVLSALETDLALELSRKAELRGRADPTPDRKPQ